MNLLILYLFWQIFYNTFRGIFSSIVNKSAADNFILELLLPDTLYWYLITLFYYYLLYFLILCKLTQKALNWVWVGSVLLSAFMPWISEQFGGLKYLYKLPFHFSFFLTGYLLMERKGNIQEKLKNAKWLPCLSLIGIVAGGNKEILIFPFVRVVSAFSVIAGLLHIVLRYETLSKARLLCYFGRNSIYIYVLHNYLTVAMRTIYVKMGFVVPQLIYLVFCLVFAILGCLIIREIVQKLWPLDVFFRPVRTLKRIRGKAS